MCRIIPQPWEYGGTVDHFMKKIAIITATRAEYGLLYPVIIALRKHESPDFYIELIVTGTHLEDSYGNTVDAIVKDGIRIDKKVHIPVDSDSRLDISKNQAEILASFASLFDEEKYDAVCLLGDRYETLAIAIAAFDLHIPIIHLYGGDVTEGAMDDSIRHSITKMSYLHFPSNESSRRRIIQLGESPDMVFNYGATGTDNILSLNKMSKKEALNSIGLKDAPYALCTYHPVTLEEGSIKEQIIAFLDALSYFDQFEFVVTKSNADLGGALINKILDDESRKRKNIHVFASLGTKRYLSLMQYAEAVIGNSSSGIMEAPSFHIPTVNIGDRQRGRLQAESTINCSPDKESIIKAIDIAFSDEMKKKCRVVVSPYGEGNAGERIAAKIMEVFSRPADLKKHFYDVI